MFTTTRTGLKVLAHMKIAELATANSKPINVATGTYVDDELSESGILFLFSLNNTPFSIVFHSRGDALCLKRHHALDYYCTKAP